LGEDNAPEEVKLFKVKDETTPKTIPETTSKDTQEKILKLIAENPRIIHQIPGHKIHIFIKSLHDSKR